VKILTGYFANFPKLSSPDDLWTRAAILGQDCRKNGFTPGAIDLLISTVAIFHDAELVTFDEGFRLIANASALKVKLLKRPVP
jgi:predicted nucleic acid-binding protein